MAEEPESYQSMRAASWTAPFQTEDFPCGGRVLVASGAV